MRGTQKFLSVTIWAGIFVACSSYIDVVMSLCPGKQVDAKHTRVLKCEIWNYLFHRRAHWHSVQFLQMFQRITSHFLSHIARLSAAKYTKEGSVNSFSAIPLNSENIREWSCGVRIIFSMVWLDNKKIVCASNKDNKPLSESSIQLQIVFEAILHRFWYTNVLTKFSIFQYKIYVVHPIFFRTFKLKTTVIE